MRKIHVHFFFLLSVWLGGLQGLLAQKICPPDPCGQFKTYTIGGWGTSCRGNNPGCYRDAHFATAFPSGLTIGCTNQLKLTTSAAVDQFLPSGSTPSALPAGTLTNPGTSYRNVLAAQLVAVTLAVGFDAADPNFAPATTKLGDQIIRQGTFEGWTVHAFLAEANKTIGGCASRYSFATLNETATRINENYDNGNTNERFLTCQTTAPLAVSVAVTGHVKCFGDRTGIASATVSGGKSPYTYLWSTGAATATISGVPAGIYTLKVTDATGATAQGTAVITEPANLAVSVGSQVHVACFGGNTGAASLSVSGGTGPYRIAWNTGGTGNTLTNLPAGIYTATITDANGCQATTSVTLTQPSLLTATVSHTDVSCSSTGSATVAPSGGVAPYRILWSTGSTSTTITNVTAGTYTVTVTDANGCTTSGTTTISQASPLGVTASQTDVLCFGGNTGSAALSITGGTAPYGIVWNTGSTDAALSNLPAGTYTATVTDAAGCVATNTVTIRQPIDLVVSAQQTNISCSSGNNGTASVTISGGVAPYSILWNTGSTESSITDLFPGTYTVWVTDANNCQRAATVEVVQPNSLSANITQEVQNLQSGTVFVTAVPTGGVAPYSYAWSTGATTATIIGLVNKIYVVTITDAQGCTITVQIRVSLPAPQRISTTSEELTLHMYPVPASAQTNLTFSLNTTAFVIMELYDSRGILVKKIFSGDVTGGSSTSIELNVENLANGMYVVKLATPETLLTKTLLIER